MSNKCTNCNTIPRDMCICRIGCCDEYKIDETRFAVRSEQGIFQAICRNRKCLYMTREGTHDTVLRVTRRHRCYE